MTAVTCKHCQETFYANPNTSVAVCPHCDAVQSPPPQEGDKYVMCRVCDTSFYSTTPAAMCPNCGAMASGKKKQDADETITNKGLKSRDIRMEQTPEGFVISWGNAKQAINKSGWFLRGIIGAMTLIPYVMILPMMHQLPIIPMVLFVFLLGTPLVLVVGLIATDAILRWQIIIGETEICYTVTPINWFHKEISVPLHAIQNIEVNENRERVSTINGEIVHAREIVVYTFDGNTTVLVTLHDANLAKAIFHTMMEFFGLDVELTDAIIIDDDPQFSTHPVSISQKLTEKVVRPRAIHETENAQGLELYWKWEYSVNTFSGITFVSILVILMNLSMVFTAMEDGIDVGSFTVDMVPDILMNGGIFVLCVLGLFYTLKHIANRTYIRVNEKFLQVSNEPIQPTYQEFAITEIQQLFIKERITYTTINNNTYYHHHYRLYALVDNHPEPIKLTRSSRDAEIMLYLEQRLEDYLGIQNRLVEGEYGV